MRRHVEKDRGYPAGISVVPAKHSHEPIAPAFEATSVPLLCEATVSCANVLVRIKAMSAALRVLMEP